MADREKVIKGLECCTFILGKRKCNECPYQKGLPDNGCYQLQDDFHAMLKEQEAKPIVYTDNPYTGLPVAKCPNCGKFARQFDVAHPGEETHYCPWCGRAVKWE